MYPPDERIYTTKIVKYLTQSLLSNIKKAELFEHCYAKRNTLIMVTFTPGDTEWSEIASLPRSLYAPRASLVGGRVRVTGGRSTGGRRDYRAEVFELDANDWVEIGNLSTARAFHGVLSVGPRDLPCLGQS